MKYERSIGNSQENALLILCYLMFDCSLLNSIFPNFMKINSNQLVWLVGWVEICH